MELMRGYKLFSLKPPNKLKAGRELEAGKQALMEGEEELNPNIKVKRKPGLP